MISLCLLVSGIAYGQSTSTAQLVKMCVYDGDTIPCVDIRTVYVFKTRTFKTKKQQEQYDKLVRDVKKVLPIANEINQAIIESYEYLQTLPNEKARKKHINDLEKGLKKQYTPRLKKLTLNQGKLLIKLVDRQNNQTSFELVKAFMGSFKANFYQTFAKMFGASLKKEYDPKGEDQLTEMVIILVQNGQI